MGKFKKLLKARLSQLGYSKKSRAAEIQRQQLRLELDMDKPDQGRRWCGKTHMWVRG